MSAGRRGFPTFGQGLMVLILAAGAQGVASVVAFIVGLAMSGAKSIDTPIPDTARLLGFLLGACGAAAVALNWASGARREPLRLLLVPKPVAPLPLGFAFVAAVGVLVVLSQIDAWLRWLIPPGPTYQKMMEFLSAGSLPLVIAAVVVVGPVSEELIFRGVILRGFLENYRRWVAIVLSSFLFSVIHLNPWQGVPTFFAGCLLALFVARTGSLLPAIAVHVLNNGLGVLAARLDIPWMTKEGFLPWWLTALGALVAAAGLLAFHRATRPVRDASAGEPVAS